MATPLASSAGDRALLDVIGFSEDARYFAFEAFGIQDGSGFAYSSLYVIDLDEDAWVDGSPFAARADEEGTPLSAIRTEAAASTIDTIGDLMLDRPAETLVLLGDGVADEPGKRLTTGVPGYTAGTTLEDFTVAIETFEAPSPLTCAEWFSTAPLGVALTITAADGTTTEMHRDKRLPETRGCPSDYRLHGVYLPFQSQDFMEAVVILSVYQGGFEGPDRRFIAVPLRN